MVNHRFGIFIPCYNAASTIGATLSSVIAAIAKTSMDIPVFVYDDCSIDDSVQVAKSSWHSTGKFEVVKNQVNSGERKTTNLAFNYFRDKFDWVFIIHADDTVKEDWLSSLMEIIRNTKSDRYFTIWSSYDAFNEGTEGIIDGINSGNIDDNVRSHDYIKYLITKVYCIWHISGAVINVPIFHHLNGFDEKMAQFGDTDFFVRGLMEGYRDIYVARALTSYRISSGSVSSVSLKTNRDILEIYYLINKFRNILTQEEIASMKKIIRRLSTRRIIKSLMIRNFGLAYVNFTQLIKSVKK